MLNKHNAQKLIMQYIALLKNVYYLCIVLEKFIV